jgi:hypothetical protein
MKFPAIFSIVVGTGMIVQWGLSYFSRQIPELETEPIRIWFHIAAELITAAILIAAGIGILTGRGWGQPLYFVSAGMLIYTAIVSPGYFAQKGQYSWLFMFGAILVLQVISLLFLLS